VLHGVVRDAQGRKMSKSLGNSLDPLEIINQFSADSLRFSLMQTTAPGIDVYISMNKFEIGRNFGTKIWNVSRFIEMNAAKNDPLDIAALGRDELSLDPAFLSDDDRHILAAADKMVADVTDWLEKYRFQDAALAIYDFVWSKFCDWHVEGAKAALNSDDAAVRAQALKILYFVLGRALRALHPFMPFLTEELWHQMGFCAEGESIMRAAWPRALTAEEKSAWGIDDAVVQFVDAMRELITAGRALRTQYGIAPSKAAHFIVVASNADVKAWLERDAATVAGFLRAEPLEIVLEANVKGMPGTAVALGSIHLPLAGLIDIPAELEKIAGELEKNRKFLAGVEAKLGNEGFVSRAPANVVEQQRTRKGELEAEIARLEGLAAALKEAE
jgi:valyl-tRNA synthetase